MTLGVDLNAQVTVLLVGSLFYSRPSVADIASLEQVARQERHRNHRHRRADRINVSGSLVSEDTISKYSELKRRPRVTRGRCGKVAIDDLLSQS